MNLPKWQWLAIPITLICLGLYYFAKYYVADELVYAHYKIDALEQDLQNSLDELTEQKARMSILEREVDVVRGANALLRASERERQDQIASLQADLSFYRRLGGASGSQAPLAIHYLELQKTQSPRVYRLICTLTQNLRWAAVISGQIHLDVDGIQDGVARQLDEGELLADTSDPLGFKFKYFQQFEQLITLPEGFEPNRLHLELKSRSLSSTVEHWAEWDSLFNDPSGLDVESTDQNAPDHAEYD